MKRLLFALTIMAGLLIPLAPRAQAAAGVSLDFFYDNLGAEGNWIEVADYGYCFQPLVAVGNASWRPYSDGYWAYTDVGWTWVSYEDFGWATYHYGRWARLADYGWVWVPGYEWAPAWVSWRTGGDYVGWAPLPPAAGRVHEGRAIRGQVDIDYDIGPDYYNFVDLRYIGEPVLRQRILAPQRNVTIINRTVNVTNITYNNSTVYNYGPDYNRLNEYSARPIQRLSLQRETQVTNLNARRGTRRNFNRVNGNQLMVVAPAIEKSQQRIAPRKVKTKVEKPRFERGWQGVANRQQLQAEMRKQDPKKVPPPTFQPEKNRKRQNAAAAPENQRAQPNESNPAARQGENKNQKAQAQSPQNANRNEAAARRAAREAQQRKNNARENNGGRPNESNRPEQRAAREARKAQQKASEDNRNGGPGRNERKAENGNKNDRHAEQAAARERAKNQRVQADRQQREAEAQRAEKQKSDRAKADHARQAREQAERREEQEAKKAQHRQNQSRDQARAEQKNRAAEARAREQRSAQAVRQHRQEAAQRAEKARQHAPQQHPAAHEQRKQRSGANDHGNPPQKRKKKENKKEKKNDEKPDQP